MAQGERLRGALRKDPNMQNLQRVSPGVYKNAQGQIVKPAGGRLPPGASTANPTGNRVPQYSPQYGMGSGADGTTRGVGNRVPEYDSRSMQRMQQIVGRAKPMDRGFSQQQPQDYRRRLAEDYAAQLAVQQGQPAKQTPMAPYGQTQNSWLSAPLPQQQFQPQQPNQFQLPDIQSGMYYAPQSVPMNQIPGLGQTGNVPPMDWNQGVPFGQYKPMIKY